MTVISFSEVFAWQTCEELYYYKYSLGLRPAKEKSSIKKGVRGHELLEHFYKKLAEGYSKEEALRYAESQMPPVTEMDIDDVKAWMLVKNYISELDINGVSLIIEKPFKVEISEAFDLYIAFTPDLGWLVDGKEAIDLEDYKFVGKAWTDSKLNRYQQLNLYMLFLREAGWGVRKGILRFFNVQTGKINHKTYTPTDIELKNLKKDFIKVALEIQEFKERPVAEQREIAARTLNYFTCQWCDFAFPCTLEFRGKDASKTLANDYVTSDYGYE